MQSLIGYQIGQYQVVEMLGEGGMGAVYRAKDVQLNRSVALKLMHSHLAREEEFRKRFILEARAIAALEHPNIVSVYDFNATEENAYMVIEYIPAGSVRNYLKYAQGKHLDLREAIQLMRQVASALNYAHEQGMVHRDVKPDNVLLKPIRGRSTSEQYKALLTDFGLVKLQEGSGTITQGTSLMGTLPYMAPEQFYTENQVPIDHRVDLYALGIMLYEVIVGDLPFKPANIFQASEMHLNVTPAMPSTRRPGLPQELEAVIMKAIAKKPEERYQTGEDFAKALQAIEKENLETLAPSIGVSPSTASESMATYFDSLVALRTAEVTSAFEVNLVPAHIYLEPGNAVAAQLQLSNQSNAVRNYSFQLQGIPSEWVMLPVQQCQLMPGERYSVGITFQVPRLPQVPAQLYPINLQVKPEGASESIQPIGSLSVAPFYVLNSAIEKNKLTKRDSLKVALQNFGNAPESFTVIPHDSKGNVRFKPAQASQQVPPGQTVYLDFRPQPRRKPMEELTHDFVVDVQPMHQPLQRHQAQVVAPGRISGLLIAFLVLLVSGGFAFFIFSNFINQDDKESPEINPTAQAIAATQNAINTAEAGRATQASAPVATVEQRLDLTAEAALAQETLAAILDEDFGVAVLGVDTNMTTIDSIYGVEVVTTVRTQVEAGSTVQGTVRLYEEDGTPLNGSWLPESSATFALTQDIPITGASTDYVFGIPYLYMPLDEMAQGTYFFYAEVELTAEGETTTSNRSYFKVDVPERSLKILVREVEYTEEAAIFHARVAARGHGENLVTQLYFFDADRVPMQNNEGDSLIIEETLQAESDYQVWEDYTFTVPFTSFPAQAANRGAINGTVRGYLLREDKSRTSEGSPNVEFQLPGE